MGWSCGQATSTGWRTTSSRCRIRSPPASSARSRRRSGKPSCAGPSASARTAWKRTIALCARWRRSTSSTATTLRKRARGWRKRSRLDPAYAMPYALLAIWHTIRVGQGWSADIVADQAAVLRLATAAIARDSFDAMALALCGHSKSILRYEFEEAMVLFDRAIEASPSSAIAWTRSSPTYAYIGDPAEAIRRVEQGLTTVAARSAHLPAPHHPEPGALRRRGVRRGVTLGPEGAGGEPAVTPRTSAPRRQPGGRGEGGRGAGGRPGAPRRATRRFRSVASSTATPFAIPTGAIVSPSTCARPDCRARRSVYGLSASPTQIRRRRSRTSARAIRSSVCTRRILRSAPSARIRTT